MPTIAPAVTTRQAPVASLSFTDDFSAFRRIYKTARASAANGGNPLESFLAAPSAAPILTTGSYGTVEPMFGIEIEFDGPDSGYLESARLAGELCARMFTEYNYRMDYHSLSHETQTWRYEDDMTVTGGEVISPILHDTPRDWDSLGQVIDIITAHGGNGSSRNAGGHIHLDTSSFGNDIRVWQRFFTIYHAFDDVITRLASNPFRNGRHRGYNYTHLSTPYTYPHDINAAAFRNMINHYSDRGSINTSSVSPVTGNGHIEFRIWDGSADMAVIQTHVKIVCAIRDAAIFNEGRHDEIMALPREDRGKHYSERRTDHEHANTNLSGEHWQDDTKSFRQFCDLLFTTRSDKEQMATLFAMTKWPRRSYHR